MRAVRRQACQCAKTFNRSEEHTSELHHSQISYAVFCLKKKKTCGRFASYGLWSGRGDVWDFSGGVGFVSTLVPGGCHRAIIRRPLQGLSCFFFETCAPPENFSPSQRPPLPL